MVESRLAAVSSCSWTGLTGRVTLDRLVLIPTGRVTRDVSGIHFAANYYTVALRRVANEEDVSEKRNSGKYVIRIGSIAARPPEN
jgi:hypothetical protein